MSFTDRQLRCEDCGVTFVFTAGEQEFFAGKGLTNDPKRCPECRAVKKRERGGGYGRVLSPKRMYPAVCAECGRETEVPFEPRRDRQVQCRECYSKLGSRDRR